MEKKKDSFLGLNTKDLQLPETTYVWDIETKVFQGIIVQCLLNIEGIGLVGGGLIDSLLGVESERFKGITVEQDDKKHSVLVKVELNILYGVSIPAKAEEIQNKITEEIAAVSSLHVAMVHVVFKNLIHHSTKIIQTEEEKEKTETTEYSQQF